MWAFVLCAVSTLPYDDGLAHKFLAFSGAAYCAPVPGYNVTSWELSDDCAQSTPGFQVYKTFFNETVDAFGFVGYSAVEKIIVGSFKGSDPSHFADWAIDLENVSYYTKNCTLEAESVPAHSGFCRYYTALVELGFKSAVVELARRFPHYQVMMTGHSLGGAAANLAAFDLMTADNIPVQLYTYGQPRTGTGIMAEKMFELIDTIQSACYYRVTHNRDVVPHVPPCAFMSNNCTIGEIQPYHSGLQMHYSEDMETFEACSPWDGVDCNEWPDLSVNDHLYYFGVRVSEYCCPPPVEADSESISREYFHKRVERRDSVLLRAV